MNSKIFLFVLALIVCALATPICTGSVPLLSPEGLRIVESAEGEIGVVAVVGGPKSGKSFLLNSILSGDQPYYTGPTNPFLVDTDDDGNFKGVWIACEPQVVQNEGKKLTILYLESDLSTEKDTTLVYLLSSTMYYTSMGRINRQEVSASLAPIPSLLGELHRQRSVLYGALFEETGHVNPEDDSETSAPEKRNELMGVVPSKIYVTVQSPSFSLKTGETAESYLQRVLETPSGNCLKGDCWPSVDETTEFSLVTPLPSLFLIDYPRLGVKPTDLPHLDWEVYDLEYKEQISLIREHILTSVVPKQFMGLPVDGNYLVKLIRHLSSAQDGNFADCLLELNLRHLSSALLDAYRVAMANLSEGTRDQSLEASHMVYMTTVFQHFSRGVWGVDVPTHLVTHKMAETNSNTEGIAPEFKEVLKTWEDMRKQMEDQLRSMKEKNAKQARNAKFKQYAAWGIATLSVAALAAFVLFP